MSIHKLQLDSYDSDFFQLPVVCGGESFLLDFSWDTIAQGHYDQISRFVQQLGETNPLVLLSDLKTHIANTNFPGYIDILQAARLSYSAFLAKWQNNLIYSAGDPDWAAMIIDLNTQSTLFNSLYISINHFQKLQNFLAYLAEILSLISIETPDKALVLAKLQDPYMDLFSYVEEYLEMCDEVATELGELEELLYWSLTVHHNEDSFTTALEIGGIHFYQNDKFKMLFSSPRDTIGRRELQLVTLWIGLKDGIA